MSKEKTSTRKIGKGITLTGILVILFGVIFHLQGRGIVGPQASFMYANPQWITNGQQIAIVGILILGVGLVMLNRIKLCKC